MILPPNKPDILDRLYHEPCHPGTVVTCLASAAGTSPEVAAVGVAAILGGPEAHILGLVDDAVSPGFNALVAGGEDAGWQRLQRLILAPVESLQCRLRLMSQAVRPDRVTAIENGKSWEDPTKQLHAIAGRELVPDGSNPFSPVDELRGGIALRLPSILLSSPAPEVFKKGDEEILDRHATVLYPDGRLFQELFRVAPSRRWQELLTSIADAVEGHDERFDRLRSNEGYGRLAMLRVALLATIREQHVAQAMTSSNEDLQRLMRQCLVVRPTLGQRAPDLDRERLRGGYFTYTNAVTSVLASRRSGTGIQFKVSDEDYRLLADYTLYLQRELPKLSQSLPQCAWVLELPWKMAWAMSVLRSPREPDSGTRYAIHVAHTALLEHAAFSRQERRKHQSAEEERVRRVMLEKLARLGPCPLRQLMRSFRIQRKEIYAPVLDALVGDGLVVCLGNRYALASNSPVNGVGAQSLPATPLERVLNFSGRWS